MKKLLKNKKGFTLIELLAVIVILGVIMALAVPAVSTYITKSKKDAWSSSALEYINDVKTKANSSIFDLPIYQNDATIVNVPKRVSLERGKMQSGFGYDYNESKTYIVVVQSSADQTNPHYDYYYVGEDVKGNQIPLTIEASLKGELVTKGLTITNMPTSADIGKTVDLNTNGSTPLRVNVTQVYN